MCERMVRGSLARKYLSKKVEFDWNLNGKSWLREDLGKKTPAKGNSWCKDLGVGMSMSG